MLNEKIGFIGTGVMGSSMAGHLVDAGCDLIVYNRTAAKAEPLIAKGALWVDSVAEVASQANIVFTILGYPKDVESVYLGDKGLLANAKEGTILVDMTTSSPRLAIRIAKEAVDKGLNVLDAPVSGGDVGAKNAKLSIMVGGELNAYEVLLKYFNIMGKNIVHQGPAGSGQHTKMANQIAIASGMLGVCEAIAYAVRSGLNPNEVMRSIESGAAGSWSLSNLGSKMISGDFAPGFYVKHFIKDMRIALESAKEIGLDLPGIDLTLSRYLALEKQFGGEDGTQGIYRLYD